MIKDINNRKIIILNIIIFISAIVVAFLFNSKDVDESCETKNDNYEIFFEDIISEQDVNYTNNKLIDICEGTVINKGGYYRLSGSFNTPLTVDTEGEEVYLILDNAYFEVRNLSAICCENADKLVIIVNDNTDNYISDVGKNGNEEKVNSAIFCECDMSIIGNGRLNISGRIKNGVVTNGRLNIIDTECDIQSKYSGIIANDGVYIRNSVLTVESEKNGIVTEKSGKEHKGDILFQDSIVSIIGGRYGIYSSRNIYFRNSDMYFNCALENFEAKGSVYSSDEVKSE